jgi:tetratricopeptide (TPR) repeat protein
VAQAKSPSIATIRLTAATRWLLLVPAVCALYGSWFVVRWYVGNTVAEYASTADEGAVEMARLAAKWAPGDPFTHWRLASLEEKVFSAETLADAVREYQLAVTLSPNDYRYWMELGRALEASGDTAGGEKALRRAIELAPAYSHPRWFLGNLLVRSGKTEEAFVDLAQAADSDVAMRPQVFNLAWQIFDGDVDQIARAVCRSVPVRKDFASYLIGRAKFAEAMRMWQSIDPADRKQDRPFSEGFLSALIIAKQFRAALEVSRGSGPGAGAPQAEQFWNGGFETDIEQKSANHFHWIINSSPAVRAGIDKQAHSGHGSLRIDFQVANQLDSIPVSQMVVLQPNTEYRFECYLRTANLITGSSVMLMIADAANNAELVRSKPAPTDSNDWQRITLDFKTGPESQAMILKLIRAACGANQVCPLFGTIWYDDFSLQRVRSSGSAPGAGTKGQH